MPILHYRGECGDAPGWYPASTLAASASHAPAGRLGNPPCKLKTDSNLQVRGDSADGVVFFFKKTAAQEMTGCLSGPGVTLGREDAEEEEETDALVFSVVRSRGEERKIGGNITLASPPSRRFLTRPHCVLLPLSLRPPPAQHQTAALAVFCC